MAQVNPIDRNRRQGFIKIIAQIIFAIARDHYGLPWGIHEEQFE